MRTVAETTQTVKAFYAQLDGVSGIALRDHHDRVHFIADATQTWQTLTDADAPRLVLAGRVDLAEAQKLADGNVYDWVTRRNTHRPKAA
jgi:hypothetical protein